MSISLHFSKNNVSTRLNNNSNKNKNFKAQENLVGRQKRSKTLKKKKTVTQIQVICLTDLLPGVLTFCGAIFNTVCIAKLYYIFIWTVAIPPQSFVHMI